MDRRMKKVAILGRRGSFHEEAAMTFYQDVPLELQGFDSFEKMLAAYDAADVDGVVIAVLFHRSSDGVKVSLRSKDRAFPVGPLARSFGGGGHDMASGATLDLPDGEAEAAVLAKLTALFS